VGVRNYLVEGVSGTGKTSVCRELERRGHQAINGDREPAYQGDPETGAPTDTAMHQHHIWDVGRVQALVADDREPVTPERDLVVRLHRTKEDVPSGGVVIDATAPLTEVVDEILRHVADMTDR